PRRGRDLGVLDRVDPPDRVRHAVAETPSRAVPVEPPVVLFQEVFLAVLRRDERLVAGVYPDDAAVPAVFERGVHTYPTTVPVGVMRDPRQVVRLVVEIG